MTRLNWNDPSERRYETGVDRGVLYLPEMNGVAWYGLTSVEHIPGGETKTFWRDGIKYLNHQVPSDFAVAIKAFTYPEEFDACNGVQPRSTGLFVHEQTPTPFGLSYRTLIGDGVQGSDRGYNIHLLYNVLASPDNVSYSSLSLSTEPSEFGWTLTSTPQNIGRLSNYRPTAHFNINSNTISAEALVSIEDILYGTESSLPRMPTPVELVVLLEHPDTVVILDNGDGTWAAIGPDEYFSLIDPLDPTMFQIEEVDGEYIDDEVYEMIVTEI